MNWRTAAMGRAVCFVASVLAFTSTSVLAQVNSWINPASGSWDQVTNWSMGVLPGGSQYIFITNSGYKAVGINPSTPVNFPGSMTVNGLIIQGATNSENTLLLNFFGTAVPLTVSNGLTLQDGARIVDFNSGMVVLGGMIMATNSQINQDGGFIRMTNSQMLLQDFVYNLTNGDFEGGQVILGLQAPSQFNQYGGTVTIADLEFANAVVGSGGTYSLYGGNLNLPGGLTLSGANGAFQTYLQAGGTNLTSSVLLEPETMGIGPTFTLNGGLLADTQVTLEAANSSEVYLSQNGGIHVVTNALIIAGATFAPGASLQAVYQLNGGTLSAGSVNLDAGSGTAEFDQTNGIAQVGEFQAQFNGNPFFVSAVNLSGGALACSNVSIADGGDILQTGGAWVVSNSLAFGGFIQPGTTRFFSTYTLLAGTLTASNITVGGIWIIGNSTTNRITNPGTCTLSNTIVISNAVEQLGRFILPTNATIDLAGSACRLSFANSSSETWAGGVTLVISNWNGNLSGGGADQIFFGSDSTGLTPQQLSQVHFINPAGLASGTYSARILSDGEAVPNSGAATGLVNSWINPASGNWDVATNWSLGILPASTQSVMITNAGSKAVAINPSTPINFPGSMAVSNLTITSPTSSQNTLLLNSFGTNVPLTVFSNLTLRDNAQILDFNSGLVVQGGMITVTNSQINQDGGFIDTTNAAMSLQDSAYNLTNGEFEGGQVTLGNSVSAQFNQFSGTVLITNLVFGTSASGGTSGGGTYSLLGGNLNLPGGLTIIGANDSTSAYFQAGGTNVTTSVFLEPGLFGISPSFTLNGGLLADNGVTLEADNFGGSAISQNGGTHIITNTLDMIGGTETGESANPAIYNLNGGTLSASSMSMDATMGTAEFNETNGIVLVGQIQAQPNSSQTIFVSAVNLSSGTLACSNISITDGGNILQAGGALIVSNSLIFGGFIEPGPTPLYSTYTLLAGTLTASNIIVGGIWFIGNSTTNRITNPGTCTLSNTIVISNAVGQLGRFILAGNSTIDLAGSASHLSFANSSSETWASGATLTISNWNGSLSGGGADQVFFGSDSTGLTSQQLSQVQFINPTGLASGTYSARILSDGEVVPNSGAASGLVNSWISPTSGNWQDATSWSLGIPPASNQSVMITNTGFKAVAIQSSTAINFPGSMTVSNLTIASPTNSANTLLLNFVGAGNPLRVGSNAPGSLVIGDTNSAMLVFSSGLIVNDVLGTNNSRQGEFAVDGTFIQSDNSEVVAGFLDLSVNGKYYLTNGELFAGSQFINGTFNQQGGTNFGTVIFTDGGEYDLIGGVLEGSVDIEQPSGGLFNQSGGTNISSLDLSGPGEYQLSGGRLVPGNLQVGPSSLSPSSLGAGAVVQTGGTDNAGNITMGVGSYTLEGGVLTASNLALPTVSDRLGSFGSSFDQSGGSFSNNSITMTGVVDPRNGLQPSTYTLSGGLLQTATITMTMGLFDQTGGTNNAGVVTLNTVSSYDFTNGLLIANNIQVVGQATFVHAGGSFSGLKNILLAGGSWVERTAAEQLGQLQLGSATNSSSLNLPSGSCVLRFADSSGVSWAGGARLTIQNWSGSTNGGGSQQVFVGTSASALTAQQLSQVQFSNPAGLPPGTYSARILSDGEVVPNQLVTASIAFSRQGNELILTWPPGWTLQSATNVVGPYSDVAGATSPYTNNVTLVPRQFFRLRQ